MMHLLETARECAAVIKVACELCRAPAGYHCANVLVSIVWPPHLSRMDAYTHRLDESEDWPRPELPMPAEKLSHVKSKMVEEKPTLWKDIIREGLLQREQRQAQQQNED